MGILMWFYVGDKRKIGEGFSATNAVPLWKQPFVIAMADFSLHLSAVDLDLLSEEACRIAGVQPVSLTVTLTENVGGNAQTQSADVVSPQWVATVASIADHQVEGLAKRWLAEVAKEHSEQPEEPTEDTLQAIRELIHACQIAREKSLPLVHAWSL